NTNPWVLHLCSSAACHYHHKAREDMHGFIHKIISQCKKAMKSLEEREAGGAGKKNCPEEQQLNENSSLNPKPVHSSSSAQNKGAVVCFQQPLCCTGVLTLVGVDPNL
ncbi:hypothetical protein XENOCAPTIV_002916, partial [Xenoophorus captivus]